jgi:hypothetical protein
VETYYKTPQIWLCNSCENKVKITQFKFFLFLLKYLFCVFHFFTIILPKTTIHFSLIAYTPHTYLVNKNILISCLHGTSPVPSQLGHTAWNVYSTLGLKVPDAKVTCNHCSCSSCARAAVYHTRGPTHVGSSLQQERNHRAYIFWDTLYRPADIPQVHHFTPQVRIQVLWTKYILN